MPEIGTGLGSFNFGQDEHSVEKNAPTKYKVQTPTDHSIASKSQFMPRGDEYTTAPSTGPAKPKAKKSDLEWDDDSISSIENEEEGKNEEEEDGVEIIEGPVLDETVPELERREGESDAAYQTRQTRLMMEQMNFMRAAMESDRNYFAEMKSRLESEKAALEQALKTSADAAREERVGPGEGDTVDESGATIGTGEEQGNGSGYPGRPTG